MQPVATVWDRTVSSLYQSRFQWETEGLFKTGQLEEGSFIRQ